MIAYERSSKCVASYMYHSTRLVHNAYAFHLVNNQISGIAEVSIGMV